MRLPDWQLRLQAVVSERFGAPFVWGSNDCGLWAADCCLAITGRDPAADLRGAYSNEAEGAAIIEKLGGMVAICAARFGPEIKPLQAQIGDIGLASGGVMVVCFGGHWLATAPNGLEPVKTVLRAWRIEKE